jgi:predicted 2-oxoglutarate/Fe(II)-dependent dioxygenase YbiX
MANELEKVSPTKILGGTIAEYSNIWDEDTLKHWINFVEEIANNPKSNAEFEKATIVSADLDKNYRTNYTIEIPQNAEMGSDFWVLQNQIIETLYSALPKYIEQFRIQESLFFTESFNILRYQHGQEYKAHYDGGTESKRSISVIFYLNDDYEGGELEFVNFDLKIKPKAGTLYVFPSSYPYAHIAHPVTSGTKYAIVSWIHDRNA